MGLFDTLKKAITGEIDLLEEMSESVKRQTALDRGDIYIPPKKKKEIKRNHTTTYLDLNQDEDMALLEEAYGRKIFKKEKKEKKQKSHNNKKKAFPAPINNKKKEPEIKDDGKYRILVKQIKDTISYYAEDKKITIQNVEVKEYNRFISIVYQFDTRGLKNIGKLISDNLWFWKPKQF